MKRIYLKNTEITEYVYTVPNLSQNIDKYGSVIQIGSITITANKDMFNYINPKSILYGCEWRDYEIIIIDDILIIEIYRGFLREINIKNDESELIVANRLSEIFASFLPYYFDDSLKTPAKLIEDIFIQYNIDYYQSDFDYADTILNENGVQVTIQVTPENNITVGTLLAELCKCGICSIGFYNNKARLFIYENLDDADVSATIEDKDIFEININTAKNQLYNGYRILYSAGEISQSGSNMIEDIDFGLSRNVTLYNPSGALWMGKTWMEYRNKTFKHGQIEINNDLKILNLGCIIELNTTNYGNDKYRIWGVSDIDLSLSCEVEQI